MHVPPFQSDGRQPVTMFPDISKFVSAVALSKLGIFDEKLLYERFKYCRLTPTLPRNGPDRRFTETSKFCRLWHALIDVKLAVNALFCRRNVCSLGAEAQRQLTFSGPESSLEDRSKS